MRYELENKVAVPKRTAFDHAAILSFVLTIPSLFIAYLLLWLGHSISYPQFFQTWWEHRNVEGVAFYCVFGSEVIGFVLGFVSLFGNRARPASFMLALVGILAGGIIGFICYSWMQHGIGGSFG